MKLYFVNSIINFLQKMLNLSIAILIGTVIWMNPFNIAQAKDPVTIRVPSWWFGEPANKDWLADVIEVFETKYPNIKVEGYNLPFGEYADTLLVEIAAGKPPDVVHLLNMNIGDFQRIDALLPLDNYLANSDINPYNFTPAQFIIKI